MAAQVAEGFIVIHGRVDRATVRRVAEEISDETEKVASRRSGGFWKKLITPNQAILSTLRTGIAGWLASPIGLAAIALAAVFAASFVGALGSMLLTAGLGAVFIAAATIGLVKLSPYMKKVAERVVNTIKGVFRRSIQPIATPLQIAFGLIETAAKRMEPTLTRLFAKLAPALEPFTQGLIGLVENMLPGFERSMAGINAVFRALGDNLPKLGTAVGDFFAELTKDPALLERVTGLLITWARTLLKIAGPLLEKLMLNFGIWSNLWRLITLMFKDLGKATDSVRSKFETFADSAAITQVRVAFQGFWDAIKKLGQALREFAAANTDQEIIDKTKNLWTALKEVWNKGTTFIKEVWNFVWGEIKKIWSSSVEPWLKQKITALFEWLKPKVSAALDNLINQVALKLALLPVTIAVAMAKAANTAFWSGVAIMAALINGINSKQGELAAAVGRAAAQLARIGAAAAAAASGGGGGNARFLAHGGRIAAKEAAIVGEKGPELFIPNTSGFIMPNNVLSHPRGWPDSPTGGTPIIQNFYITTQEIDPRVHAAQLGWEIVGRS